jgi:hypothetical protein
MRPMNPRERMLACFNHQPLDRFPVTAPYLMLQQADLWEQIYKLPSWKYYEWCLAEPEAHIQLYRQMDDLLPYDIAQPNQWASSHADRQHLKIVAGDSGHYQLDDRSGERKKLIENLHEKDDQAEWDQTVFTSADVQEKIEVMSAAQVIENGHLDYMQAYIRAFGHERFVAGTLINSFYLSSHYVGLKNRFLMILDEPELLHAIIERLTLRNIEEMSAFARVGCDAIFIDDATATKDMVSMKVYDEFCLPYLRRQVDEAHHLGMKVIVIYFGGIADRVENIVSTGADGLMMETSMKGYVNDLAVIADQVNDRMLLFGNLDPVGDIEQASDAELEARMRQQIAVGKKYGRMVVSTGSPITPDTTLARVQKYITLAQQLSAY